MRSDFVEQIQRGYPGKRYYSGNQFVDQIELAAQNECLKMLIKVGITVFSRPVLCKLLFIWGYWPGDKIMAWICAGRAPTLARRLIFPATVQVRTLC
jgi:hypothetical protein